MSTNDLIEMRRIILNSHQSGVLFPVEPLIKSDPIVRTLYVSAEVSKMLVESSEPEWNTTRSVMDYFVSGGLISVPAKGIKSKPSHHMARLDPEPQGVWSMRATTPKPGIRVIGQFVEKDLFVGLAWQYRNLLGGYSSKEWKNIVISCQTNWRNIFTSYPPLKGGICDDYISNIIVN